MPDLFVDSASGSDTAGGGDTAATALRTVTFAINEAARRFGVARVGIRLAPGLYSNAAGELFPFELPQNLSLLGSGAGRSIIRYERGLTSSFEQAISGGEELADFTLQGMPLGTRACYQSTAIFEPMGTTHIHDVAIERAPGAAADEVGFGIGVFIRNDALVERVTVDDCEYGIELEAAGFRVTDCTVRNTRRYGITARNGPGEIRDCTFLGNHWALNLWADAVDAIDNTLDGNFTGITVGGTSSSSPPLIRGNAIYRCYEGMVLHGEAQVIDNDIVTDVHGIGILVGTGTPPRAVHVSGGPAYSPEIRNNRLHAAAGGGRGLIRVTPLAAIGGGSRPVFEGNRFSTATGPYAFMSVHNEAVPDLGYPPDGRSMGRNIFAAGYIVFFQDAMSPPKTVRAHGNYWANVPVVQGTSWLDPRDWYVDPARRRGSVTLDTTGAMRT
jgi:hypothetical protein